MSEETKTEDISEDSDSANIIELQDFEIPGMKGLEKFIADNDGNESDALKSLWVHYRSQMEWKDYAIGAGKSITKLMFQLQAIIRTVRESTGVLSHCGYKDDAGNSLVFSEKFQDLVRLGTMIKDKQIEDHLTEHRITKVKNNKDGTRTLVLDCGHTEEAGADVKTNFKPGMILTCQTCIKIVEELRQKI